MKGEIKASFGLGNPENHRDVEFSQSVDDGRRESLVVAGASPQARASAPAVTPCADGLRQLLGDPLEPLAAVELAPDLGGCDAERDPACGDVVEQVRAFADRSPTVAPQCLEAQLDGLFRDLLGHLGEAVGKELRRARPAWVAQARIQNGGVEPAQ